MMRTETKSITVPGKPMTWARARATGRDGKLRFFTDPARESRMGEIALFWRSAGHGRVGKPNALALQLTFVFDRPASHFGSGKNAGVLKERYRHARPPSGKNGGDLDNLCKLIKDGLNSVAWQDDSQVAKLDAEKRYCEPGEAPHTEITVVAMDTGQTLEERPDPEAQLELAA